MTEPNRVVTIDANTRVGQSAICAALASFDGGPFGQPESPERRALRMALFGAISGLPIDRCIVASDGKKIIITALEGTPYAQHLYSEGVLIDLISDGPIPARGLWIFEGRVDAVTCGDPEELDDQYFGEFRAINDEDRMVMMFTDEDMIADAYCDEIDVREPTWEVAP